MTTGPHRDQRCGVLSAPTKLDTYDYVFVLRRLVSTLDAVFIQMPGGYMRNASRCPRHRRGCRAALLVALAAMPNACARYCAASPRPVVDSVGQIPQATVRVTTTDGTTQILTRVRIARDTLFGMPPGFTGPEYAFALADIQRVDMRGAPPSHSGALALVYILGAGGFLLLAEIARHIYRPL